MFNDFVEQGFHDMCLVWCLNFLLRIILQARGKGIRYLCEADTEWKITCASWSWGKQGQEWTTGWLPSDNSPAPVYDDHHIIRWWWPYYHEDPTNAIHWPDPHLKLTSTWVFLNHCQIFSTSTCLLPICTSIIALCESCENEVWSGQLWQYNSPPIFNENEPNFHWWCKNIQIFEKVIRFPNIMDKQWWK